jgi:GT2 family glycosyltransferase
VNISFRREALADNAFSLRLGRTDKGLYGGEEIELCRRLLSAGWKVIYNPKAVVHHIVPLTRTHQDYFVQRALDWGVSRVIVDRSGREGTCRAKQLMSYLLRYCFHMIKYVGAKITRNEGQVFNSHIRMRSYRVSVNYCLGRVP